MAPEELEAMMAQGGNGGPPEQQPPPEPETPLEALLAAVKTTAMNARGASEPEAAQKFGQAAFFLAQAAAKLDPPEDPNEMAKAEADREKVQTAAQVDRERMAADAQKAQLDREAKAVQERIKVERDEAGQATAYVKGGN